MKKKKIFIFVLSLVFLSSLVLSGCGGSLFGESDTNPQDLIKNAYGNEQYTVSFNMEGLDEPLPDITYTAQSMPKLPTPTRVGYIFEGWYFDGDYTVPYIDGILYLYMSDVTLYAKWSKEEFVQNGTYDIEFEAAVLGGIGEGVKDITEALVADEIYIEKSNKGLMLRLQYDCGTVAAMGELDTFTLGSVDSAVNLVDSVVSDTDPVKTLYFNIENIDIAEPIYFSVTANSGGDTPDFYTMEFRITRLIGFSRPFADPDVPLENGYYLVNTYFRSADGEEVMGGSFNPVYSYIIAEEGNYTLVKPFIPYTGMVGSGNNPEYLYERMAAFFPMFCYYDSSEGSAYGDMATEFHADSGRVYNIFDLGDDVKKELYVTYSVTGFMETAFGYGTRTVNIDIDYDHMIRVTEIDYAPLSGEYYQYADSFTRYGSGSTQKSSGMYDEMKENGMTTDMVNFYYSALSADSSYSERTMLSHRMTISAASNGGIPVSELDYTSTRFSVRSQIYGYDSEQNLYADIFSVGSLTNGGLRGSKQIAQGKSLNVGDRVSLSQLYTEKVNPYGDYAEDNATAEFFAIEGGKIDFSSPLSGYGESFVFQGDVAVRFTVRDENGNTARTVVELADAAAHGFEVWFCERDGVVYAEGDSYDYGDFVPFPDLHYSWNGVSGSFIGKYYDVTEFHPLKAELFSVSSEGAYSLVTAKAVFTEDTANGKVGFRMNYEKIAVVYELENKYGEKALYEIIFELKTPAVEYFLSREGQIVESGTVTYQNGVRQDISIVNSDTRVIQSVEGLKEALRESYVLCEGGVSRNMAMWAAAVLSENGTLYLGGEGYTEEELVSEIETAILSSDYALFYIQYKDGEDRFMQAFSYNVTFDGLFAFCPVTYADTFTGETYTFRNPYLVSRNGTLITKNRYIGVYNVTESGMYSGYTLTSSQEVYTLSFQMAGTYTLTCYVNVLLYTNRNLFGSAVSTILNFHFVQTLCVLDGYGTGTITFVAAKGHPFSEGYDEDGDGRHTVTVNLKDIVRLLSTGAFETDGATLYGWSLDPDATFRSSGLFSPDNVITNYVGTFNEQNITLYAVWDEKLSVTLQFSGEASRTFTYSLSSGSYSIDTSNLIMYAGYYAPNGQELIGFCGGFFGEETVLLADVSSRYIIYEDTDITIRAVYAPVSAEG